MDSNENFKNWEGRTLRFTADSCTASGEREGEADGSTVVPAGWTERSEWSIALYPEDNACNQASIIIEKSV